MELQLLITLLPIIFRAINAAPKIQEAIRLGTPMVKAVEENAGDLLPLLTEIGKQKFPAIDDRFAPAAAASTMLILSGSSGCRQRSTLLGPTRS